MKRAVLFGALAVLVGLIFNSRAMSAEVKGTIDPVSGKPCYRCHASKVKGPFVHSGLADRECTPCHSVSNGNHQMDHSLNGVKDKSSKVCYECHENHLTQKSVHPPLMDNDCLACHAPHRSNFKSQLGMPAAKICFECHDQALVTEKETDKNGFRDGTSNLHYSHVTGNNIPCLACHDAHASSQLHLVRLKGTNGKDAVTITYTTTPKGGNCTASCHDALGYERK